MCVCQNLSHGGWTGLTTACKPLFHYLGLGRSVVMSSYYVSVAVSSRLLLYQSQLLFPLFYLSFSIESTSMSPCSNDWQWLRVELAQIPFQVPLPNSLLVQLGNFSFFSLGKVGLFVLWFFSWIQAWLFCLQCSIISVTNLFNFVNTVKTSVNFMNLMFNVVCK